MNFRGGMNEMMRQAARLQRKVEQAKKDCEDREIVASAVGEKVKATVTYGRKLVRVEVDPEFLKSEGIDMALDGVCAAVNSGMEQAEKAMEAEVEKATGGLKIPGMT